MKNFFKKHHKIIWCLRNFIPMLLFPVANFYLFELYIGNPWENIKVPIQFLNIYLFELLMLILFFIFGRLKWALRFQSIFFMLAGLINYYVISFRSAPIMPWDIFSFGTALSVADNYKYTIEKNTIFVLIGFVIIIICTSVVNLNINITEKWKKHIIAGRITIIAILAILLSSFTNMLHQDSTIIKYKMYDKLFTPTVMSKRDGTAVAFLMELKYISVDKPNNYSVSISNQILEPYNTNENVTIQNTPNIIVIMNEAFSDLSVLGDFQTNEDYMPFIRSLMQEGSPNTVSGKLNVSVLGGNTANTEFEFLTGNTMAFLPQGSVPYQQYLKSETQSIASHLKSLGYETIAMHPYNSTGWDRNKVYPLLGFDNSYFIRDYKNPERIRKYVSDAACYDKIIEMYESKTKDTPLFVFNVTMQNHSSYTEDFDNFTPQISVNNSNSKSLNNYLSLMKISDSAIEELINYFSNQNEDTIIVFFGDHQPTNSVVSNIWKLNGKDGNNLSEEDEAKRYEVPFFIWSNFDIEEESNLELSANYLGAKLLDVCKLPLYDYAQYLLNFSQSYPVVTPIRVKSSSGESTDLNSSMGQLNNYAILQYNRLFDK